MKIIGNGALITFDQQRPFIEKGGVLIDQEKIKQVDLSSNLVEKYPTAEFIDCSGKIIMPALINAHTHFYSTFARGMALDGAAPRNFNEILAKLWWRLDKALNEDDIYYSALLAILEGSSSGTATFIDHHASPNAVLYSLDRIAEAVTKGGVRAVLSYEVSDRDGAEIAQAGIKENIRFAEGLKGNSQKYLAAAFGLHASFTLSEQTLTQCAMEGNSRDLGFHLHVAEGSIDQIDAQEKYNIRVLPRLQQHNILNKKSIAVHGIDLLPFEIDILQQEDTIMITAPRSNMGNAVGRSSVEKMLARGVLTGLGTDGYPSDMLAEMKVASLIMKFDTANPQLGDDEALQLLFANNPLITERFLNEKVGIIKEGYGADIICLDYQPVSPLTKENCLFHLLMGAMGCATYRTIIGGKTVWEKGEHKLLDAEKIYYEGRAQAKKLWQRV